MEPLKGCSKLKRLGLTQNAVRDTSPLTFCSNLEDLEICDNPVDNFSGLVDLLKLKKLAISAGQLTSFSNIKSLPTLNKLSVDSDWFDSFMTFPDLPRLKVIWGAHVRSLSGIEKFTALENIINMSGEFSSLDPLRGLRKLTHVNILESKVRQLEPMSELLALREIHISTSEASVDFSSLYRLPALHELTVRAQEEAPPELIKFCDELSSWDTEFYSPQRRHEPSLEIEVVDQETFDFYDGRHGYGITSEEINKSLLSSELSWLDERLEAVLQIDFEEDEDYSIPFRWPGARSRTVVLLSEAAIASFRRLALGLQEVLCHARHDWILYFQSDSYDTEGTAFIVWLYPDKIVTTPQYADTIRRLIAF